MPMKNMSTACWPRRDMASIEPAIGSIAPATAIPTAFISTTIARSGRFRDWVIDAFNRNEPFDQFTIEQLAGDLIPNRTLDQQIASGFNRCNITTSEGGAIDEEYRVLYARDRTETTVASVARSDGRLRGVPRPQIRSALAARVLFSCPRFSTTRPQPAMDGNNKDTPPVIFVPQPADRKQWDALAAEIPVVQRQMDERKKSDRAEFEKWLAGASPDKVAAGIPSDGLGSASPAQRRIGQNGQHDRQRPIAIAVGQFGNRLGRGARGRSEFQSPARRSARNRRRRRFRQEPAVHRGRLGQIDQGRAVRLRRRADGRSARFPRLGPVDAKRASRLPYHQPLGQRRDQGAIQPRGQSERMESCDGHLRRLRQSRGRDDLYQRRAAADDRVGQQTEEHDAHRKCRSRSRSATRLRGSTTR